MIRRFDPIDILFIVLISCYLVTFSVIVLFFVTKYLKERKLNNKGIEKLKLPDLDIETKKDKKKSKRKKVSGNKKTISKNAKNKKTSGKVSNKRNTTQKKKPNNSKKSPYVSKNKKRKNRTKKSKRK